MLAEVHAMLFETEETSESQPENKFCLTDQQQNQLEPQKTLQDAVAQNTDQPIESHHSKFSSRLREFKKRNTEKAQPTYDLKSYAISRNARKYEQQLRLSNITKRIYRSLENEPANCNPSTRKETSKQILNQTKLNELKKLMPSKLSKKKCNEVKEEEAVNRLPKITYSQCKVYTANQKQLKSNLKDNNSNINQIKSTLGVTNENLEQPKTTVLNTNRTSFAGSSASPLVTNVEYLPNFDFKLVKSPLCETSSNNLNYIPQTKIVKPSTVMENLTEDYFVENVEKLLRTTTNAQIEDPLKDIMKSSHKSTFSTVGSPQMSKKRPSLSELTESKRFKSEEPGIPAPRSSLNFDLSDSVVEFLQVKILNHFRQYIKIVYIYRRI